MKLVQNCPCKNTVSACTELSIHTPNTGKQRKKVMICFAKHIGFEREISMQVPYWNLLRLSIAVMVGYDTILCSEVEGINSTNLRSKLSFFMFSVGGGFNDALAFSLFNQAWYIHELFHFPRFPLIFCYQSL